MTFRRNPVPDGCHKDIVILRVLIILLPETDGATVQSIVLPGTD